MLFQVALFSILISSSFAACPPGWFQGIATDVCYQLSSTPSTFSDATLQCNNIGGFLVSIPDSFTDAFLTQKASAGFVNVSISYYWIGGTNQQVELQGWRWIDGVKWSYTNWGLGK